MTKIRLFLLLVFASLLTTGAVLAAEPAATQVQSDDGQTVVLPFFLAPQCGAKTAEPTVAAFEALPEGLQDLLPADPSTRVCVAHAAGCQCVGSCTGGGGCLCSASSCCSACCGSYRSQCC